MVALLAIAQLHVGFTPGFALGTVRGVKCSGIFASSPLCMSDLQCQAGVEFSEHATRKLARGFLAEGAMVKDSCTGLEASQADRG